MATPAAKIRPYSNFLTPLLHRRFMRASAALSLLCYVVALMLGQWTSWFWSWFPFGWSGLRAGMLFISAFSIFVLRVSQLHVGSRTTASGFESFKLYALRYETFQTAGWYLFSAWLYTEVYIFSAPRDAHIYWITDAKNNERPRLNERPIYLTAYFLMLALAQTGVHLYYDYDRIPMPTQKSKPIATQEESAHLTIDPMVQLRANAPKLLLSAVKQALIMTCVGPIIYAVTIRQTAWSWTLMFAKIFWNLPKSTALPVVTPFHWRLLLRTFTGGAMLVLLWEVGNAAFSFFVAQAPLKNERPITFESRDPNGSLITGLKGKKLQTRAFAFWELTTIAKEYQGRRKTIYEDIDRAGGSSWSQISTLCLDIVGDVGGRIGSYLHPAAPAAQPQNKIENPGLPRLTSGPKKENIFSASPPPKGYTELLAHTTASIAKTHGNIPSSPVDQAKKILDKARSAVLTPAQEEALTPTGIFAIIQPYALQILESYVGIPFRQDFRRRINAIVLGGPYGDVGIIVDAIDSLTRLAVHSLQEDPYGNVQNSIPVIFRSFTSTIAQLEMLKKNMKLHWTDVEKKRESPEVEVILATLRADLKELIETFGPYADDLKISQNDLRSARSAIAEVEEQQQQQQQQQQKRDPKQKQPAMAMEKLPEKRQKIFERPPEPEMRQRRSRF